MADPLADLALSAEEEAALRDESAPPPKEQPTDENPTEPAQSHEEPVQRSDGDQPRAPSGDSASSAQPRTPEGKFAAKAEEKPEADEQRQVPLAALREERKARQELERKLAERDGVLSERLRQLQERIAKPEPEQAPEPLERLSQAEQRLAAFEQREQQATQLQQFAARVQAEVSQFKKDNADYDAALAFARESRISELKALGVPEDRIGQQVAADELGLAMMAVRNGQNPGQLVMGYATARGFKKAAPAAQEKPAEKPAEPSALEKLATIEAGQKAAKSLGNGGAAPDAELTLERLAAMSLEQLSALPEEQWRAVMGA